MLFLFAGLFEKNVLTTGVLPEVQRIRRRPAKRSRVKGARDTNFVSFSLNARSVVVKISKKGVIVHRYFTKKVDS